jgi:hypothetical protein
MTPGRARRRQARAGRPLLRQRRCGVRLSASAWRRTRAIQRLVSADARRTGPDVAARRTPRCRRTASADTRRSWTRAAANSAAGGWRTHPGDWRTRARHTARRRFRTVSWIIERRCRVPSCPYAVTRRSTRASATPPRAPAAGRHHLVHPRPQPFEGRLDRSLTASGTDRPCVMTPRSRRLSGDRRTGALRMRRAAAATVLRVRSFQQPA